MTGKLTWGDFLVDRGTGRPEVFTGSLAADETEHWYQFTTLGDGQPGNYVYVSPTARQPQSGTTTGLAGIDSDSFWPEFEYRNTVAMVELFDANGGRVEPISRAHSEEGFLIDGDYPSETWLGGRGVENRKSLVDTRDLEAGTYYLRVYAWTWGEESVWDDITDTEIHRSGGSETHIGPFDYTIEMSVPSAGWMHPVTDHDTIFGGAGDDYLVGNHDVDGISGQSGQDRFIAEAPEITDFAPGETRADPAAGQFMHEQPAPPDPVITAGMFGDPSVARAVLNAAAYNAGIAVTHADTANPIYHGDIHQSDLAEIVALVLDEGNISDLGGLEYCTGLRGLSLNGQDVSSLLAIGPGVSDDNLPVGAPHLQWLDPYGNEVTDLSPLELMVDLRWLNLDHNRVTSLGPLAGLEELELLSAMGPQDAGLADLTGLERLKNLQFLNLTGNPVRDLGPLVGHVVLDDDAAEYTGGTADGWLSNVNRVETAYDHDYHFTVPPAWSETGSVSAGTATWQFDHLPADQYEVFVTCPIVYSGGTAEYTVNGGDPVTLHHSVAPAGPVFDGQRWESLGTFDTEGTLAVTLASAGDGSVAADAVRIVPTDTLLPNLSRVRFDSQTPLDNRSRDEYLALLPDEGVAVDNHAPEFLFDPIPETFHVEDDGIGRLDVTFQACDLDGDDVLFTAVTDHPNVAVSVTNHGDNSARVTLAPTSPLDELVRVTVTAVDQLGRAATHSFNADFNADHRYWNGTKYHDEDGHGVRDWQDANGNGLLDMDEGEPGIDGWRIDQVEPTGAHLSEPWYNADSSLGADWTSFTADVNQPDSRFAYMICRISRKGCLFLR